MSKPRKKISFATTKRRPKKIRVSFSTKSGKKISFLTVKRVPKKVKGRFD